MSRPKLPAGSKIVSGMIQLMQLGIPFVLRNDGCNGYRKLYFVCPQCKDTAHRILFSPQGEELARESYLLDKDSGKFPEPCRSEIDRLADDGNPIIVDA